MSTNLYLLKYCNFSFFLRSQTANVQLRKNCNIYFTIKNENNAALPPIEYSVITRGKALKQQETENGFSVESVIVKNNDSRILYLDWEWVFDGNDEHDTLAGIEGKDFTFTIKIVAEETSVKNN